MRSIASAVAMCIALCACRERSLQTANGQLHFEPATLVFSDAYVDRGEETREVFLFNDGHSTLDVTLSGAMEGFRLLEDVHEAPPGRMALHVQFFPKRGQAYVGALSVSAGASASPATLRLSGTGLDIPTCPDSSACHQVQFDVTTGTCREVALPDGALCNAHDACLIGGQCVAGACVGTAVNCDDGDACTTDSCNAMLGCQHDPAPPCPGDGACNVGVCNPKTGCGLAPAADGIACGPLQGCDAAQVCVAGACVVRDPPDGYTCAEATPCQGKGSCQGSTCVQAPAQPLTSQWTHDSDALQADGGYADQQQHDFLMEENGAMTLSGFFHSAPRIRANTVEAVDAEGPARRCILWNHRLVCADSPAAVNGKISSINMATGDAVWTFDVRFSKSDYLLDSTTLFLARLVSLGSNRLAALYEAYPRVPTGAGPPSMCRSYYLVILDSVGALVSAAPLKDAFLDTCAHPHPYGVAADKAGNLYVAFSMTANGAAPLEAAAPSVLLSFSGDGALRYRRALNDERGGELAVADGVLVLDSSRTAYAAESGLPLMSSSGVLGRAAIQDAAVFAAPEIGATWLRALSPRKAQNLWLHQLPAGTAFSSDETKLGQWKTSRGPVPVQLSFVSGSGGHTLYAVDTRNGTQAFSCPLAAGFQSAPQRFELGRNVLGVMEGATTCSHCDPGFAGSNARFYTISVPTLEMETRGWVGTFGGAGHDHQEE